mmetsp:Transcript_85975/g.185664  ORF Transcript_85975/g.185664 Transcript_85975/m.185664 type:complete len:206 (+) Transcript_85975:71-688(+)
MFLNLIDVTTLHIIREQILNQFDQVVALTELVFLYCTHDEFLDAECHGFQLELFSPDKALNFDLLANLGLKGGHVEFCVVRLDVKHHEGLFDLFLLGLGLRLLVYDHGFLVVVSKQVDFLVVLLLVVLLALALLSHEVLLSQQELLSRGGPRSELGLVGVGVLLEGVDPSAHVGVLFGVCCLTQSQTFPIHFGRKSSSKERLEFQ